MSENCNSYAMYYSSWIFIGALSGGFLSGIDKLTKIWNEPDPIYILPIVEIPIRGVYQASRIAAHVGWGCVIAGITAATAPISIPLYISMMK